MEPSSLFGYNVNFQAGFISIKKQSRFFSIIISLFKKLTNSEILKKRPSHMMRFKHLPIINT